MNDTRITAKGFSSTLKSDALLNFDGFVIIDQNSIKGKSNSVGWSRSAMKTLSR
jgi:hypothetical protein